MSFTKRVDVRVKLAFKRETMKIEKLVTRIQRVGGNDIHRLVNYIGC